MALNSVVRKVSEVPFLSDGTVETPILQVPAIASINYRDSVSVDTKIYFQYVERFVKEPKDVRDEFEYNALCYDGDAAHIIYAVLL